MNRMLRRLVIAGASGFVGKRLIEEANAQGFRVVALSRSEKPVPGTVQTIKWNGETNGEWAKALENCLAVINLAGSPISEPWTIVNRQKILESRVKPTRAIAQALEQTANPPTVWLNASAIGFYGDTGEDLTDEDGPRRTGFLGEVCGQWEQVAQSAEVVKSDRVRLVLPRLGVVLGRDGGYFAQMRSLTQKFLGGHAGNGRQWVSWIHEDDLARLLLFLIQERVEGPINAVSPEPVRQADFMAAMREKMGMPWSPPVPEPLLKLGGALMKIEPSLALVSQRIEPRRAVELGFQFEFPTLEPALSNLLARRSVYYGNSPTV